MINELLLKFIEVLLRVFFVYLPNIINLTLVYLFDSHVLLRGGVVTILIVRYVLNAILFIELFLERITTEMILLLFFFISP